MLSALGKKTRVVCGSEIPAQYEFITQRFAQECGEAKTVVSVDTASLGQWGNAWAQYGRCDLSVDHHVSHESFEGMLVLDPDAAATSVIMLRLARELGVELTADMADAIFLGITTDTGCFKYANANIGAHEAAIEAMRAGADTLGINRRMFETKSRSEMEIWRMIMDSIEYHAGGRIAVVTVTRAMREKAGFFNDDLGELASIPRQIEGVACGITIKQQARCHYKISIRTNDGLSAQQIAAQFGGGGHNAAAGCTIKAPLLRVKYELIKKVEELLG